MSIKIQVLLLIAFSIFPFAKGQDDPESEELSNIILEYTTKGFENVDYNLDTAEYYLKAALRLQYTAPDYEIDKRVAGNHINLASVYRIIFNNSEALHHLTKAEEILKEKDPSSDYFGALFHNKGNVYQVFNDLYKTKEYYEYALDFLIRNGSQNTGFFAHIFSNQIKLLFELGESELAEQKLEMVNLQTLILNPDLEFRLYNTYASAYSRFGKYELANLNFEKARKILEKESKIVSTWNTLAYYFSRIDSHILFQDYSEASKLCQEALVFIESLDQQATKNKTLLRGEIIYRIASIKHRSGDIKAGLENVNQCIGEIDQFYDQFSFADGHSYVRNEYASTLPLLHILKSRLLHDQYLKLGDAEIIKESLNSYQTAIRTLNSMKLSMRDENSKIFATSEIIDVYNEAIYIGKLLYEITGNSEYLEMAFEFTESSKSFALFSEIKNVEAMEFSDLPTAVKEREEDLIGKIQGYEGMLYREQMSTEPDSAQIAFYKHKLFHLKDDKDDLMREIELNNEKYFEFKYKPKFVSLKELQKKLPYRDAMIEYVLTDTLLITYVIDKKNINVFSQEIGPEFSNECLEYYQLMNKQNFSGGVHESYKRFVELGRKFYSVLIEPCLEFTEQKSFTIVPDGAITYLPFEGFLTEDADPEYTNYLTLPYLIREFSVGYSQSATLMFSERLKSRPTENKVLAFAPLYYNPISQDDTASYRQVVEGKEFLLPLGGIIKEVQSIKETVPSRVFMNEKATEANFKKYAPDYNVLHLAMHTIMKDDNPLRSLLAFTTAESSDPADTIEDNRLYTYEVYNLPLNAEMAVLSSCSSGFGKMHKGEGMMSLARGFYYAGCPSIIMTLWQVSDKSSSELMTDFYKYLKKGKSKQEAMRLAKIDYLDASDDLTSNPYFWLGFVVLGDNSPVYKKSGMVYWISIIALFIGILVFFQYRKR
ncbi:MAG: CHAT domain-containing protein [Bacteroidetes bacterium]|nr:CHAT domain-containing protein [Bacteroidota bacterium]